MIYDFVESCQDSSSCVCVGSVKVLLTRQEVNGGNSSTRGAIQTKCLLSGFRKEGYHELCQITFLLLCWLNNIYFQVDFTPKYF